MNYINLISSPDELDTPVIICSSSGLVVYKNYSAMKNIRLPRRNTHIQFHLDRGGILEYENIPSRKKPSVISVDTGDRKARAFVMPYKRGTENCSLWVFFSMLQVNALSRVFTDYERDLCDVGYEICDIVRCLDEKTFTLDEKIRTDADIRIDRRLERVLNYVFLDSLARKSYQQSFDSVADILTDITEKSFDKIGYDVRLSIRKEESSRGNLKMIEFREFILLYLYITTFASKLSRDRRVDISIIEENSKIVFKTEFSLGYPSFTVKGASDVCELAALAPKYAINLLIVSKICSNRGLECVCDVTEESHNNVSVKISVPESISVSVHSHIDNQTEQMLIARDIQAAIYYMFLNKDEE